jgi:glycerol-3-phosphate dehydrogenase
LAKRESMIERIRDDGRFDVAIIGGGATGLGAAVDAALRGYRVALVEARDFASGTSSRSTKLVHGGVRYLARGEIHLVREALHERGVLEKNAPALVNDRAFLVPAYSGFGRFYYGLGLKVYDWLAGPRNAIPSRIVDRDRALELVPTLKREGLKGGVVYHDGQFDDSRLAIELMRRLVDDLNAIAVNYLQATRLIKQEGMTRGLIAVDLETGEELSIHARAVVNATGVGVDRIRKLDDSESKPLLEPSQGAHLVIDRDFLPGDTAIMIPKTSDGRVLFAIPWLGKVVVGTTDTPVAAIDPEPKPLAEEVSFLLDHLAQTLDRAPTKTDVKSAFAGLRPLLGNHDGESTAKLSREHVIETSKSGLTTITGGKWTTYRVMGEDAIDRAIEVAGLTRRPSRSESFAIGPRRSPDPSKSKSHESELIDRPGVDSRSDGPERAYRDQDRATIDRLVAEDPSLADPIVPGLSYRLFEVALAARFELARTVEDVLARRTRALFLDARGAAQAAPKVAAILARELGRDQAWRDDQIREFQRLCQNYVLT